MLNEKSRAGHAIVIGAGVMGTGIAALLANIGWRVSLLDCVPADTGSDSKSGNRLAQEGLDRALKLRPPQFALPEYARRIRVGNTDDHLDWAQEADWVVEAIAEDPAAKNALMQKLTGVVGPNTVISSNTSGLSLEAMIEGCPADFRARFLGTHFFNPPRFMKCVEIAPTANTDPEVFEGFARFADRVLGKRIIRAKDTPGFISTRLGMYNLVKTIQLAVHHGMTVEQVDYLTGPLIGRPKSGTFRLADVIGLDITARIIDNLKATLPHDGAYQALEVPDVMRQLVKDGRTGAKVEVGFYKREKSGEILSLDLKTAEYRPHLEPKHVPAEIEKLSQKERLSKLLGWRAWDDEALLGIDRIMIDGLSYIEQTTPLVADSIIDVDDAMMFGFGWEMGPFQTMDAVGELNLPEWTKWYEQHGIHFPPGKVFVLPYYKNENGNHFYRDLKSGELKSLPRPADVIILKDFTKAGKTVEQIETGSVNDLGDGIACLEWHTKMNVLDPEIIGFIDTARERAERDFAGLVIGGSGSHFSAGFDIRRFVSAIETKNWDALDAELKQFQDTLIRLKYSPIPVVCATYGYTLGGGCEAMLHCAAVQAAFESSIGLPEANVGIIPAGGGTTERLVRAMESVRPGTVMERSDAFSYVRPVWDTIRQGRFSTSADEARQLGFLREGDEISVHPDRLIHDAKHRAIALAQTYRPPTHPIVMALAEDGLTRFKWEIHLMRRANQISEHDARVAERIAWVMCGGDMIHPAEITERYLLDLEREAFLVLAGTPETLARIKHTLETGKPLRN